VIGFRAALSGIELAVADRSTIAGRLGLHRSRGTVLEALGTFSLDSFGGALVTQRLSHIGHAALRWRRPASLALLFFVAKPAGGSLSLAAARCRRVGLIRTSGLTHIPGNVLAHFCAP